jgi:hypothetical protein
MYDVNPLGPLMHLRELERQANSTACRAPGESRSNLRPAFGERLADLLRLINRIGTARPRKSKAVLR